MKKNVPSDDLEAFLKNAFEEYAESPSEEVWDRIAAAKGAAPKPIFKILHSYPLWIGMAAAILTGFIIYQSVQVNQELRHINRAVEQQHAEIQELKQPENTNANAQETLQTQVNKNNDVKESDKINKNNKVNVIDEIASATAENQMLEDFTKEEIASTKRGIQDKKHNVYINKNKSKSNIVNGLVQGRKNTDSPQSLDKTIYTQSIPTVGETSAEALQPTVANGNPTNVFELNKLANLQNEVSIINQNNIIAIPPALTIPIEPIRTKSGFYVGVNILSTQNKSRISTDSNHPMPPHDRKEFTQSDEKNNHSLGLGLRLGKDIGRNWSVESGALYRSTSITSTHQATFKFRDRKFPPHGGGGPRDCQFDYDLNTPNGTVAVSVTVESRANSSPLDEEEVGLDITSEQSLSYLSVPLLLNYQIGKGKLHINAKGGLLTNFLLHNNFNVTNINSSNDNFKPQANQRFKGEPIYFNELSLDYLLQVGVAYDITRNLSVNLDPTFVGSITNQSSNRFIQSSNTSVGLSAGLTWGF